MCFHRISDIHKDKKGIKFLISKKRITVSRDVKFIKSIFRLHNIEEYNIKDENRNRNHVGSNPLDDTYDDETDTILDTTDQVHVVDHPVPNNNSSASTSP